MTERSVTHATFVVERTYEAAPARVFNAWADPQAKAEWFADADGEFELDFRIGGREINRSGSPEGPVYLYDARYQDIVPDERIVYTYDMYANETRISVSLATVEFKGDGERTRVVYTEQGAYLDGLDTPDAREQGMGGLFDALAAALGREPAKA